MSCKMLGNPPVLGRSLRGRRLFWVAILGMTSCQLTKPYESDTSLPEDVLETDVPEDTAPPEETGDTQEVDTQDSEDTSLGIDTSEDTGAKPIEEGTELGDCGDQLDNDLDGWIDCDDWGCWGSAECGDSGLDSGSVDETCVELNICEADDPCVLASGVGTADCLLLEIVHSNIGSNGFAKIWRGQDISFAEDVMVTGVGFASKQTGAIYQEFRVMTEVNSLETLASTMDIAHTGSVWDFWETGTFEQPICLLNGAEYTAWFHLIGHDVTNGCLLTSENPSWGAHHTDTDPEGQNPSQPGYWDYEYGTNIRVYGCKAQEV